MVQTRLHPESQPPRLVLADLDGTFLDDDKHIPEPNMAALDELHRRDIPFVVCTGRGVAGVPVDIMSHPALCFVISANGALIQEVEHEGLDTSYAGRALHEVAVNHTDALALFEFVRERPVSFDVFADGRMMMEERYFDLLMTLPVDPKEHLLPRTLRERRDIPSDEIIAEAHRIERVSCFWGYEDDRDAILSFIEGRPGLAWASGDTHIIEVTNVDATKGNGMSWLCDYMGINRAEAWAFGDSENDVTMLAGAGIGVALANSMQVALDAADQVTAFDNNAGGFGRHLLGMLG